MNALFSKIGLKQKFFAIFCIVLIFSIYQIISDTIVQYKQEQISFQRYEDNLKLIEKLNTYVYTLQKDILELRLYNTAEHSQKLSILRKSEKLKKELQGLLQNETNQTDYGVILKQWDIIIKNIHLLSHEQILLKYELIFEKLFLQSNYLSSFLQNNYLHSDLLKLIHSDIAFELYHLNRLNNFTTMKFDPLFINQVDKNYASLLQYKINTTHLNHLKQLHQELKTSNTKAIKKENFFYISTKLIDTYLNINHQLYNILHSEIEKKKEYLAYHFNLKLGIEVAALIITLMLLYYFYKSLFIYIRKIQHAHKIKSIFLSNMSHELRTPLNAIIGFLNILKNSNDEKEQKKFVDIIYKSSKQLLYIINDILDFSKIEDAKLKIEKKPFNIKEEFKLLIELFSANASSKNITLKTQFDENIPDCIVSDKFRIKQIVSNLISNAIKFTQEGGTIKIIIERKENKLLICVEDNGIGISKKAQKTIFKSFLQAKDSTARKYGGTGLGLSISSKLVNLLGSKLKVSSKEFYGSRFSFYLKIKECKSKQKEIKTQENISSYKGCVLLVEDNPTNQFLMQITFNNLKLDVILANDGNEAVERFKHNKVDIVFMDDNMPNKNGVEATKEIIKYEEEHQMTHVPIIALTANTGADVKKRLLKAGMDEYMPKPFDIKLLHQILQKYLH